jgi:beta-lactamase superfamily II metal-dependent hydrolase
MHEEIGFEMDVMAIGEESSSGDAIIMRAGNLFGARNEQVIGVFDGGYKKDGQNVVDSLNDLYGAEGKVDFVINSHPDGDHSGGLIPVLEQMRVGHLLMHRPWSHANSVASLFEDGHLIQKSALSEKAQASMQNVRDLETIAMKKGISIEEPFSYVSSSLPSCFTILGPSREYYRLLADEFCPADDFSAQIARMMKSAKAGVGTIVEMANDLTVKEDFWTETLLEPSAEAVSAVNNSSVILHISIAGKNILLTADAGVPALSLAADCADAHGINLRSCDLQQVPHHGSKRNVGPTLLDRIVGSRQASFQQTKMVFVSAAVKGEPKHPSGKVTNAYKRRGAEVFTTQGTRLHYGVNAPSRGSGSATPYPFQDYVEGNE